MKLDSDDDFQTSGKVISLCRGRPDCPDSDVDNLVTLTLDCAGIIKLVDFPIYTKSSVELAPYQTAFIGQEVRYSKKHEIGITNWRLEVLFGCLRGSVYEVSI